MVGDGKKTPIPRVQTLGIGQFAVLSSFMPCSVEKSRHRDFMTYVLDIETLGRHELITQNTIGFSDDGGAFDQDSSIG